MHKLAKGTGNFISWFSAGFIAICPVCQWAGIFLSFGQIGFLLAIAKILTPLIIFFVLVSILSFYLTYKIHRNIYPLMLSTVGGVLVIYAILITKIGDPIVQFTGILLLSSASLIDFNYRFKQIDCQICKIRTNLIHEHAN